MAKAKKVVPEPIRPKMIRPIKPMASYTSADDLNLIIERAKKWGDLDYAALAEARLAELQTDGQTGSNKKAARPAKARHTA
jgi:hypothetical protein